MVFVVSGPSGSGKTTLITKLLNENKNFKFSISYTTRKKREGEVNGKDYFFINKEDFKKLIKQNFFIEWAQVYGNFYGTSFNQLKEFLNEKNKHIILDIDVQGAINIKNKIKDVILIFIKPPDLKILKERLINRKKDNIEIINKRLQIAKKELEYIKEYNYCIENNKLELSYNIFKCVINNIIKGG